MHVRMRAAAGAADQCNQTNGAKRNIDRQAGRSETEPFENCSVQPHRSLPLPEKKNVDYPGAPAYACTVAYPCATHAYMVQYVRQPCWLLPLFCSYVLRACLEAEDS